MPERMQRGTIIASMTEIKDGTQGINYSFIPWSDFIEAGKSTPFDGENLPLECSMGEDISARSTAPSALPFNKPIPQEVA